jgi:hypothetical protein
VFGDYYSAAVCLNGHSISSAIELNPQRITPFCAKCGAKTVYVCSYCCAAIRGAYAHGLPVAPYVPPRFCDQCGNAHVWTESALVAAEELADELDGLRNEEKELLKKSLDDIVRDTPQAQVGALRFKRLVGKAGGGSIELFKEILKGAVSEAMLKILFAQAGNR